MSCLHDRSCRCFSHCRKCLVLPSHSFGLWSPLCLCLSTRGSLREHSGMGSGCDPRMFAPSLQLHALPLSDAPLALPPGCGKMFPDREEKGSSQPHR